MIRHVAIIEKTIPSNKWPLWSWVQLDGTSKMPPLAGWRLNLIDLNMWAEDRLIEAIDVMANLGLRHHLWEWDLAIMPFTLEYRLMNAIQFYNEHDAVAFRLAWEPDSILPDY